MQRLVGNQAVQRWLGAPNTNQAGADIQATLSQEFRDKHVAANVAQAKQNTIDRINNGDALPTMRNGTLGNIVATAQNWQAAIDAANHATMPPEDDWVGDDPDDGRFFNQNVLISGWEVKRVAPLEGPATKAAAEDVDDAKRSLGGTWDVGGGDVTVEVDHASTGR
jgi:hypothetical protein